MTKDITTAAIAWWEDHRPVGWTLQQHFKDVCINCITNAEIELAKAISLELQEKKVTETKKEISFLKGAIAQARSLATGVPSNSPFGDGGMSHLIKQFEEQLEQLESKKSGDDG